MTSNTFYPSDFAKAEWFEAWLGIANSDPEFLLAARELECQFLWEIGDKRYLLRLDESGLTLLGAPKVDDSWSFALRAPLPTWERLMSPLPPPGSQSLTSLRTTDPEFRWEGDMLLAAQALHALQRLVEIARNHLRGRSNANSKYMEHPNSEAPSVARDPSLITGRYVELQGVVGESARVYYEESGQGLSLLFLHTAGADSRQYQDLLSDVELAKKWHMFAFDLPFHGRSNPPDGWWRAPYRLSADAYAHWCVNFIRTVVRDRPVVVGCSMGAVMAVYLAARYRDAVRAIIGLEAPDRSPGRRTRFLAHPQVNQAAHNPSYVYGLMSPQSPEVYRRRAWWYYSQSGFGVYEGDLYFYSDEWDSALMAAEIDTTNFPVFLLTGEYDYSSPPEATKRLAERIPGARFKVMEGLGHFPMTEHPEMFRVHLLPVLEELRSIFEKWGKAFTDVPNETRQTGKLDSHEGVRLAEIS